MHVTFRGARLVVVGAILLAASAAPAQPAPGLNEVTVQIGGAVGLTDTTPGGFKLATEYGRKITQLVWFNAQLNFVIGDEGRHRFSGDAVEMIAGIKLKFPTGKFLPYAKIGAGIVLELWDSDHEATALAFRGGGGLKYFVLPWLGVGGELVLTVGPNFLRHDDTHAYFALDFLGGVEFIF